VGCTTATPAAAAAATPADDDDDTPASRPTSVVRSPTQAARPHGTARHGTASIGVQPARWLPPRRRFPPPPSPDNARISRSIGRSSAPHAALGSMTAGDAAPPTAIDNYDSDSVIE